MGSGKWGGIETDFESSIKYFLSRMSCVEGRWVLFVGGVFFGSRLVL
jgi:hypothetical protein